MSPKIHLKQKPTAKASSATSSRQKNPFLSCPPKLCTSCEQTTHDYERDLAPTLVYLKWQKTETSRRDGTIKPSGQECYYCFDTRRRYFTECQVDLNAQRKLSENLNGRWAELRKDKVTCKNEFKSQERVDAASYVKETATKFQDMYEEGNWFELHKFAEQRNLRYPDDNALISYIKTKLNLEVGPGPDGGSNLGVFVMDHRPGAPYRFKRGVTHAITHERTEKFTDEGLAQEKVDELNSEGFPWLADGGEGVELAVSAVTASAAFEETEDSLVDEEESAYSPAPSSSHAAPSSRERTCHRSDANIASELSMLSRPSSKSGAPSVATSSVDELEDEQKNPRKRSRATAADMLVDSAGKMLAQYEKDVTAEAQWNKRMRVRDFETMQGKLTGKANKVATLIGHASAADVAQRLFDFSVMLQERKDLFEQLRTDPEEIINTQLDRTRFDILSRTPVSLCANIVSNTAFTILARPEAARWTLCVKLAKYETLSQNLNVSFARSGAANAALVSAQCQRSIVAAFADKAIKGLSTEQFVEITADVERMEPSLACDVLKLDVDDVVMQENGWTNQALLDLVALCFFGQIIRGQESNDGRFSRETRAKAASFVQRKNSISVRLRTHCVVQGPGVYNNAKLAWDIMEKLKAGALRHADADVEGTLVIIKAINNDVHRLISQEPPSADELYENLCDVFNENQEAVRIFASLSAQHGHDLEADEKKELVHLADSFIDNIARGVDIVLKAADFFQNEMVDAVYGEPGQPPLEEAVQRLSWVHSLLDLLLAFRASDQPVAEEDASNRAALLASIAEARWTRSLRRDDTALRDWSDIWVREKRLGARGESDRNRACCSFAKGEFANTVATFIEKAAMHSAAPAIIDFVKSMVGSEKCERVTPQILALTEQLRDVLPQEAWPLFQSARTYTQARQCATRISEAKSIGLLECSSMMAAIAATDSVISAKMEFKEWTALVKKEWSSTLTATLAKHNAKFLTDFLDRNGKISEAVENWQFVEFPWLSSSDDSEERSAQAKRLEVLVNGLTPTVRVLEALAPQEATMHWATVEQRKMIKDAISNIPNVINLTEKCALTMAMLMLCNTLLVPDMQQAERSGMIEGSLKYATTKLHVKENQLPAMLATKLAAFRKKDGELPPAASSSQKGAEPPKKLLKKLTKAKT